MESATAVEVNEFLEGMKARREFMIKNNPIKNIQDLVNREDLIRWCNGTQEHSSEQNSS